MASPSGDGTTGAGDADSKPANDGDANRLRDIFGTSAVIADPAAIDGNGSGGTSDSGSGTRRRGRPRGSTNKTGKAKPSLDLSGVEKLLLSIHSGIATLSHIPEFEIAESEAKSMAEAFSRVARHYPVLDRISEKTIDHVNLFTVMAGTYGSRVMAVKLRLQNEREENATRTNG